MQGNRMIRPILRVVEPGEPAFAVHQDGMEIARFHRERDARILAARLSWDGPVEVRRDGLVVWRNVETNWSRLWRRIRERLAPQHGAWVTCYEIRQNGVLIMTALHPDEAHDQASFLVVDGGPVEILEIRRRVLNPAR